MNLFSSLKINKHTLENRVVVPPMARENATVKGEVTEETLEHYRRISEDPAITIVEHSYISKKGKYSVNQLGIYSDELINDLNSLSDVIKDNDSLACIQINHAGNRLTEEVKEKSEVIESVNSLDSDEMDRIKKEFTEAAIRAEKAGFDAVEIHGAHGFLLNSFLSPLSNKRDERYGGSLRNRMRYPLEVIDSVRDELDDMLIFFRLGATDLDPNGLEIGESKEVAVELIKHGVDVLDVSGGLCGSRPEELQSEEGYFIPFANEIKLEIDVPVIGVGGIKNPKRANEFVKQGKVDLVAVGRELLKNYDWVKELC